jgi:hypothetical protein
MNMKAAGIRKALYSLGAEPLTIPMVRVRKHTRLSRRGCVSTLTIHMVRVRKHTRLSRRGCVSTLTIHMVRGRSLIHMGEGHLMLKIDHTQKKSLILAQNER